MLIPAICPGERSTSHTQHNPHIAPDPQRCIQYAAWWISDASLWPATPETNPTVFPPAPLKAAFDHASILFIGKKGPYSGDGTEQNYAVISKRGKAEDLILGIYHAIPSGWLAKVKGNIYFKKITIKVYVLGPVYQPL